MEGWDVLEGTIYGNDPHKNGHVILKRGERKENTRTHCKKIILDQYMNNMSSDLPEEGFYVEFMSLSLLT